MIEFKGFFTEKDEFVQLSYEADCLRRVNSLGIEYVPMRYLQRHDVYPPERKPNDSPTTSWSEFGRPSTRFGKDPIGFRNEPSIRGLRDPDRCAIVSLLLLHSRERQSVLICNLALIVYVEYVFHVEISILPTCVVLRVWMDWGSGKDIEGTRNHFAACWESDSRPSLTYDLYFHDNGESIHHHFDSILDRTSVESILTQMLCRLTELVDLTTRSTRTRHGYCHRFPDPIPLFILSPV